MYHSLVHHHDRDEVEMDALKLDEAETPKCPQRVRAAAQNGQ